MRRSTGWLGALLSLAFAIAPAFAQDKAATPVPGAAPAPKEPAAVAVADIALRADADERFAEAIILRAREEFCRLFFDEQVPPKSAPGLRRCFLVRGGRAALSDAPMNGERR